MLEPKTRGSSQDYWDAVAPRYDRVFPDTLTGRAQRDAVHRVVDRTFRSGQRVLELNCGTGIDALHLAARGVSVLACDISPEMIDLARKRSNASPAGRLVELRVLRTEEIARLHDHGPFHGVLSNFSGLNHVMDLHAFARDLARLLEPGARCVFCVAGRFSAVESMWSLLHADLRGALRRVLLRTDDPTLTVAYRSARAMARMLAPEFQLERWTGVGVMLPSCVEPAARRFPTITRRVAALDLALGRVPGVRSCADCLLLELARSDDR